MAMDTYTTIATKLEQWLNRESMTALTDQTEDLIALAQRRAHRSDFNAMLTVDSAYAIDAQYEAAPTNFLRAHSITIVDSTSNYEVQGAPLQQVMAAGQSGRPRYYHTLGSNIYFGPIPDQEYTATIVYYQPLDILSTTVSSNWFSTNTPELILFGALMEAALFLKDDNRAQVWEARFNQVKNDILLAEGQMDKESGGLQVRVM